MYRVQNFLFFFFFRNILYWRLFQFYACKNVLTIFDELFKTSHKDTSYHISFYILNYRYFRMQLFDTAMFFTHQNDGLTLCQELHVWEALNTHWLWNNFNKMLLTKTGMQHICSKISFVKFQFINFLVVFLKLLSIFSTGFAVIYIEIT